MSTKIKIRDLADPILTDFQSISKEYGEQNKPDLSVDKILDVASNNTGLDHYGDEKFIERLNVLINAIALDRGLAGLGQLGIINDQIRYLENRLRFEDFKKQNPEFRNEKIENPIIIIGLPRSGTTHLLNLIASDTRIKSMPYWESRYPIPWNDDMDRSRNDPRVISAFDEYKNFLESMPLLKSMHDMHPDHIHEEIELQALDFSTYLPEWLACVPDWRDYYLNLNQLDHYRYLKEMLKAMQFISGPKRWVLKSPQHLEQIDPLIQTFPNATFIITYRDPLSVVLSIATMLSYGDRVRRYSVDPKQNFSYWEDRIEILLKRFVSNSHLIPRDQRVDVFFQSFIKNNLKLIKEVYSKSSINLDKNTLKRLNKYIADHQRGKDGQVIYKLDDFDVNKRSFYKKFSFYLEEYNLAIED